MALASRKDARDAVVAARKAAAEVGRRHRVQPGPGPLPGRRDARGPARRVRRAWASPAAEVDAAIDRWVWYAGWADKIAQVHGGANPVAGPYFNLSAPEPTGVVGVVAPASLARAGQRHRAGDRHRQHGGGARRRGPQAAVTLAEVLATSDLPGGVVNILTGRAAETAPWLASHVDVNALDLTGVTDADAGHRAGTRRGRQPQAGAPAAGRHARLHRRPRAAPDDRAAGDQDRLAPQGFLTSVCLPSRSAH